MVKIHDIALASVLEPDEAYYYRKICRSFSERYHMPLPEVEKLPYDYVLRHYFEHQIEQLNESDAEEAAHALEVRMQRSINPNYDAEEEESIEDFVQMIEDEIAGKRKVKKKLIKDLRDNFPSTMKIDEGKQSLTNAKALPVTSKRKVFDQQDQVSGDSSGLETLDDLKLGSEDDKDGNKLP
jgi:hypothetical protein